MKVINPNKALAVALGTAGLFWATNKRLPDWLIVTTLLATTITLARDVTELIEEMPNESNQFPNNQNMSGIVPYNSSEFPPSLAVNGLGCINNPLCACNNGS